MPNKGSGMLEACQNEAVYPAPQGGRLGIMSFTDGETPSAITRQFEANVTCLYRDYAPVSCLYLRTLYQSSAALWFWRSDSSFS